MKKGILIAVCVVVIVACAYYAWPTKGRITPEMGYRPRVCEACNERVDGPSEPIVTECPKCKKRAAVRVHLYECRDCGESFEAFRSRLADETATEIDDKTVPEMVYKREGGEWKKSVKALGQLQCPKCKSANVKPPRPT
ncbi:hypothetical protein ACFL09_06225 [Planctomycetota bacterium]